MAGRPRRTLWRASATIVVYSDGAAGHPLLQPDRLKTMGALMDQGVGLVCLHFAVEPTIETGEKEFLNWIGGAFEINWSVNPVWTADFKSLPDHPITRGVKPFRLRDEWYFHMRFREDMKGVTPILSAVPDASTTNRNDGPHEGNPVVREMVARGEPQARGLGGDAGRWRTGLCIDRRTLSSELGRRQFAQAGVERDSVDGENRSSPGRRGLDGLARPAQRKSRPEGQRPVAGRKTRSRFRRRPGPDQTINQLTDTMSEQEQKQFFIRGQPPQFHQERLCGRGRVGGLEQFSLRLDVPRRAG